MVADDRQVVDCHLADPGRMRELLVEDAIVHLAGPFGPPRKLPYSAILAEQNGVCVNLVSALPNTLVPLLLEQGDLPQLCVPERLLGLEAEVKVGDSRLDFCLEDDQGEVFVEAKSVTWVRDGEPGVGYFPDAPSQRARKHVLELASMAARGQRAAVVFVAGRGDIAEVAPAEDVDPDFASALRQADAAGVTIVAVGLSFDSVGVFGPVSIPVRL